MDTGLKGRTVLITGASRNIGRETALAFAREGANLSLCARERIDDLKQVADDARQLGVKVYAQICDVTDHAAVAGFVQQTREQFDRVDVAINLAGYRREGKFLAQDIDTWKTNIEVNLSGPFHVCRNVIPLMMERRWGRIINISGIAPYAGFGAAKAMVKLGTVGFTRGLAREFGPYNITANCVGPGAIGRQVAANENEHALDPTQPIKRKGRAQEVVSAILYLASENAGFITGQSYLVNGGKYFQ